MPLITLLDAQAHWGDLPLLDQAQFSLEPGERVGLIGRNGTGKSTLLNVLANRVALDDGERRQSGGLFIHLVEQEPVLPEAETLVESLALRGEFHQADERDVWRLYAQLDDALARWNLDPQRPLSGLSGGEKKRAALALACALTPDVLLLDEPTNHLDVHAIIQLENWINDNYRTQRACVLITHDRVFLDHVVTRIVELDRGMLRTYPGNFSAYETRKAQELEVETQARREFDKFWAQEEAWIRKGIEARRTRNEGRVRRLEALRVMRSQRRDRMGNVTLTLDAGERSGKIVAEVEGLTKRFGDKVVVKDFNYTLMRGDRLGLIGPNGVGKSTLIKLLLGELEPDSGRIKLGTNIKVAYFDQLRSQLDETKTVADNVSPGSDYVEVGGQSKHIVAYLGDFLFPPRRLNVPVSSLSGGERNRLLLAKLFTGTANVLVLDEPTNDLDMESLEVLETTLSQYEGTLILVSHDRQFVDNVVSQVLVAQGDGTWMPLVGGMDEWLRYCPAPESALKDNAPKAEKPALTKTEKKSERPVKLSYRENEELEKLPEILENLEKEQGELLAKMSEMDYHKLPINVQNENKARLHAIEEAIAKGLERWEELELKRQAQLSGQTS